MRDRSGREPHAQPDQAHSCPPFVTSTAPCADVLTYDNNWRAPSVGGRRPRARCRSWRRHDRL